MTTLHWIFDLAGTAALSGWLVWLALLPRRRRRRREADIQLARYTIIQRYREHARERDRNRWIEAPRARRAKV